MCAEKTRNHMPQFPQGPSALGDPEEIAFAWYRKDSARAEAELRRAFGGCISAFEFASRISRSAATVRRWRRVGAIVGVRQKRGGFEYPAWQIYRGELLPGLEHVLGILRDKGLSPLTIISVMITRVLEADDLSPLVLLRRGRIDDALGCAHRYGDIGA